MGFKDIGVIIRKINGPADNIDIDLKNKSKQRKRSYDSKMQKTN